MAETEGRIIQHEDVEHGIATFRRNLMESMKTGHWVAACWNLKDDGLVECKDITMWLWENALVDELFPALKKRIAEMAGPAPGENDPLPMAEDFMEEIAALAKDGPPGEEGK